MRYSARRWARSASRSRNLPDRSCSNDSTASAWFAGSFAFSANVSRPGAAVAAPWPPERPDVDDARRSVSPILRSGFVTSPNRSTSATPSRTRTVDPSPGRRSIMTSAWTCATATGPR